MAEVADLVSSRSSAARPVRCRFTTWGLGERGVIFGVTLVPDEFRGRGDSRRYLYQVRIQIGVRLFARPGLVRRAVAVPVVPLHANGRLSMVTTTGWQRDRTLRRGRSFDTGEVGLDPAPARRLTRTCPEPPSHGRPDRGPEVRTREACDILDSGSTGPAESMSWVSTAGPGTMRSSTIAVARASAAFSSARPAGLTAGRGPIGCSPAPHLDRHRRAHHRVSR